MEIAISKIAENGQVVIPQEIRKEAHIKGGMKVLFFTKDNEVHLRPITKEDIEFLEDLKESEREFEEGKFVSVDSSLSAEEIDKILMES